MYLSYLHGTRGCSKTTGVLDDATSEIYYAQLVEEESRWFAFGPLRLADTVDVKTSFATRHCINRAVLMIFPLYGRIIGKHSNNRVSVILGKSVHDTTKTEEGLRGDRENYVLLIGPE